MRICIKGVCDKPQPASPSPRPTPLPPSTSLSPQSHPDTAGGTPSLSPSPSTTMLNGVRLQRHHRVLNAHILTKSHTRSTHLLRTLGSEYQASTSSAVTINVTTPLSGTQYPHRVHTTPRRSPVCHLSKPPYTAGGTPSLSPSPSTTIATASATTTSPRTQRSHLTEITTPEYVPTSTSPGHGINIDEPQS